MKKYILAVILTLSIFSVSCSQETKINRNVSATSQPQPADDGWQTASLNDVAINSKKLQTLVDKVSDSTYQNIHSILIVKEGKLVFEKIDSTTASVLYSWGDHPAGYFKNGWVRRTADVDSDGKIKFTLDSATLTFELDKHEDVLIGYYKRGEALSKLILDRL